MSLREKTQSKCSKKHLASLSSLYSHPLERLMTRNGWTFPPPIRPDLIWVELPALFLPAQWKTDLPSATLSLLWGRASCDGATSCPPPWGAQWVELLRCSAQPHFPMSFFNLCFLKPSVIHWLHLQSLASTPSPSQARSQPCYTQ